MTAPVRTIAARFTAEGSEAVKRAVEQVSAAARSAAERTAAAAAKAAARTVEVHNINAAMWQRSVQAAERAAHAEAAAREQAAQRIIAARQRETVAAERAATAQAASAARASTAIERRYGNSARAVAASLDAMANAGRVTGEAIRTAVTQTANMALMFSPTGPIVAAVGIAAISIVNLFANARAERKRLEEESIAGLGRMMNAYDLAGIQRDFMDIEFGTADKGRIDALGQKGSNSLEEMRKTLERMKALKNPFPITQLGEFTAWTIQQRRAIAEQQEAVDLLTFKYEQMKKVLLDPTFMTNRRVGAGALPAVTITPDRLPEIPNTPIKRLGPVDFSPLERLIDAQLAPFQKIQPLGDPAEFAKRLNADLKESIARIEIPPMPFAIQLRDTLTAAVQSAVVTGFAEGIEQAVASGSIADGFSALSAALLSGLGSALIDFGTAAIAASKLMQVIKTGLMKFFPPASIAGGLAMIALGATLRGVASRAFGNMGRGGAGGGGFSSAGAAVVASAEGATRIVFGAGGAGVAAGMTPRQFTNVTVIGPDDPRAQRAITELIRKAEGRGLRSSEQ